MRWNLRVCKRLCFSFMKNVSSYVDFFSTYQRDIIFMQLYCARCYAKSLWVSEKNNVPVSVNKLTVKLLVTIVIFPFPPLCFTSQAQFSHIGASLHTRTPFSYRVPADSQPVFLLINVLYAVVPQALCYRCCSRPAFFLRPTPDKKIEWQRVAGRERVPGISRVPK